MNSHRDSVASVVLCPGQPASLMKTDILDREDLISNDEAKLNWNHLCSSTCQAHGMYFLIHLQ